MRVGHAHDERLISGVTAIVFDRPAVAGLAVVGGAPAGRDTQCLDPSAAVPAIDAIVLSGGSGFGLDAAGGVQAHLREQGRGFEVGRHRVPIVPQAVCFDLGNGGDKAWGRFSPYRDLGYAAAEAARPGAFALGSAGGGYGASTADLRGGVGSASAVATSGAVVGAIAVVNAIGSAVIGGGPWFWAAPFEVNGEFGGLGLPADPSLYRVPPAVKGRRVTGTTIALVATDARLEKSEAQRLAWAAQAGLAKALGVSHALMDGDMVFAAATGDAELPDRVSAVIELGTLAGLALARAVARGVYEAGAAGPSWQGPPAHVERFARS